MSKERANNDPVAPDHQLTIAEMRKQLAIYERALQPNAAEEDDDVIDLRALWNMLMRRRWTVISTVAAIVVAAFVYTA